jgi:hypothetical protein
VATFASTFTATNGTQTATLEHDFDVSEPPSGATRVASVMASGDGSNFDHSKALPAFDVPAEALIVVKLATINSGLISAVTDTAGNTYVKALDWSASTNGGIWYCLSSVAKTGNVITANFSNGNQYYGLTAEAYTGGTFAYDAANSGYVSGAYSTSPVVSSTINAAAGSLVAVNFAQYNESLGSTAATQSPGAVINTAASAGINVMASGELIPSSAFSGTISASINQTPPTYTKVVIGWAHFTLS